MLVRVSWAAGVSPQSAESESRRSKAGADIMSLQVTGKNFEVGEAFQKHVADRIAAVLEKYIGPQLSGHVRVEKERGRFITGCSVRLRTGVVLEATGEGTDAYASAEAAIDRLEKQVRRYKRKLKSHHSGTASKLP
jgi:ribosomal subunit interface protein